MITFNDYILKEVMKTFRQFNAEEQLSFLTKETNNYIVAGEISNKNYSDLKNKVNNLIDRAYDSTVVPEHHSGQGAAHAALTDKKLAEVAWTWIHDAREVMSLKKKLDNVKDRVSRQTPIFKAQEAFYLKFKNLSSSIVSLKDKVVKISVKRAEAKVVKDEEIKVRFTNSQSLVRVLEDHKAEYLVEVEKRSKSQYAFMISKIAAANWNLDKFAPSPTAKMSRNAYIEAQEIRQRYYRLVHLLPKKPGEDQMVEESEERKASYIKSNINNAITAYNAFISKMTEKVGKPVASASLTGSIWTGCQLKVTTNDGENQIWETKMIINFSKYGLMFNQFPSRQKS